MNLLLSRRLFPGYSGCSPASHRAVAILSFCGGLSSAQFNSHFSATRSLALRALGFSSSSVSPDTMGFRVRIRTFGFFPHTHTGKLGGQVQPLARSCIVRLTMRSSREWKVMTASRPPGRRLSTAA